MRKTPINFDVNDLFNEIDLLFIEKRLLKNSFILSEQGIPEDSSTKQVIEIFNRKVLCDQLPKDISFARMISALAKLKKRTEALQLFTLVNEKASANLKEQVIGKHTLTAVLQIYNLQITTSKELNVNEVIVAAEKLWEICEEKKYVDYHLMTEMLSIYFHLKQYQKFIKVFSLDPKLPNFQMRCQYTVALIKTDDLKLALQELNNLKMPYGKTKNPDSYFMRPIYDAVIHEYFEILEQPLQAVEIFKEAKKIHLYQNLLVQNKEGVINLQFSCIEHFSDKNIRLPLSVVKVAFLNCIGQPDSTEMLSNKTAVSSTDIKKKYNVKIEMLEHPNRFVLAIPNAAITKTGFISDILSYFDSQEMYFDSESDEREVNFYMESGWSFYSDKKFKKAINQYQKAIALTQKQDDPENTEFLSEAYRKMGLAYYKQYTRSKNKKKNKSNSVNLTNAFNCYLKATQINPNNLDAHYSCGIVFIRLQELAEATKKFTLVTNANPEHWKAYVRMANCLKQQNDYPSAADNYQRAIGILKKIQNKKVSLIWIYCELGNLHLEQFITKRQEDFFRLAENAFKNALELDPSHSQACDSLKELYKLKGYTPAQLSTFAQLTPRFQGDNDVTPPVEIGDSETIPEEILPTKSNSNFKEEETEIPEDISDKKSSINYFAP